MKKISVLIPVYNTSRYLERCLNSVINQSLKDIEIICVNDGSIDNSLEILKKYKEKDNRIIIIDKKNKGSSSARNEALKIARGEYCLNIDSDDWIEQGYLEGMYEKAKKENLDMLISDIIFDYEYKKEIKIKKDLDMGEERILTGEEYLKFFLSKNFFGYTWNKLIKKEIYEKYNLKYDEKIFLFEDVEIISKLAFHMRKIGKLNKAYYHYVQGENNGSSIARFKNYLDIKRCFSEIKKYYLKNNVNNELIELLKFREEYSLFRNLLFTFYERDKKYSEKEIEILSKINTVKEYSELIEGRSLILFFRLERKIRSLKVKIIIFRIIKNLIWFKQKLEKNVKY